jgi:hypothetical protein
MFPSGVCDFVPFDVTSPAQPASMVTGITKSAARRARVCQSSCHVRFARAFNVCCASILALACPPAAAPAIAAGLQAQFRRDFLSLFDLILSSGLDSARSRTGEGSAEGAGVAFLNF